MTEPLYIVDTYSQVFKAYYAIRGLRSPSGLPTNAVFGFAQMTNRLIKERGVTKMAAAFDPPGPTSRDEIFTEYKEGREPTPEDLIEQIPLIERYLELMGIPKVEVPGWEADDVIAALAHWGREQGRDVFIISADKDLLQLVGPGVTVLRVEQGNIIEYGPEQVKAKMGVPPEKIADMLALMGDSVDNIPGVKGIGPKSASAIMAQFDSVEDLLENLDRLDNKRWKQLIEDSRENLILSKRLTVIDPRADLPFKPDEIHYGDYDTAGLIEFYKEMNFHTLVRELAPDTPPPSSAQKAKERVFDYRLVRTAGELKSLAASLTSAKMFAIDTETTGTDPWTCDLIGLSLAWRPNEAVYIPVAVQRDLFSRTEGALLDDVKKFLGGIMADKAIKKFGHNIKFDMKILERAGLPLGGVAFDSMIAAYLLSPDRHSLGLKSLAYDELGISMTPITDLIGKGKNQISMLDVPLEQLKTYACADADCTLQLGTALEDSLKRTGLKKLYDDVEQPLLFILKKMEDTGVRIDEEHFKGLSKIADEKLKNLAELIFESTGETFNLSSPKQLADILFVKFKLPILKQGKTGPSTDVSVLEELKSSHPVVELMLQHRTIEKLKNTYIDVMPRLVNRKTGRIHTSFNQTIAATGRLSSSNPNLQNIPVGAMDGINIRRGFIPLNDGDIMIAADYSQIELRVLAHMTGDPALVAAYRENRDIHALTASKIFKTKLEDVTPAMRAQAKMVNFGVIYGMSARGLQQRLGITFDEARTFINEYFEAYAGVKNWIKKTIDAGRDKGYVTTLLNRRRYLSDISSKNRTTRSNAERIAINTPIQGTAADMIKLAMVNIDHRLQKRWPQVSMMMQVHDELIFNVPQSDAEGLIPEIKSAMEQALPLSVPVVVDIKTGENWAECK